MALKKSCEKKSFEIKSYHFETLFPRTFLWLQYDFIQKRPRKKFYFSRKCMGTKDVNNHAKKGAIDTLDIFDMQMFRKKSFLQKRLGLNLIFTMTYKPNQVFFSSKLYNSCDLISWDFIGSPYIILGKKSQ